MAARSEGNRVRSGFPVRLQFAWVIGWHILLRAFTVGAAAFIAVLEGYNLATRRDVYLRVSMFWIRIFSIAFGMGVAQTIVKHYRARNADRADAGIDRLELQVRKEGMKG
jgi:hypothetical protein